MPSLFVGIDLGGSGTRAALADADGNVLATGRGPTGLFGGGGAAANRRLGRALDAALAPIAALAAGSDVAVVAGTRGLSVPGRRERLELELHTRFPSASVRVSNDALIGLWGALAGQAGVAVLAGSGSIALARDAKGREARAGGWGYLVSDDGSGYWIGREALRAYLSALEQGEHGGSLRQLLFERIGTATLVDVLAWLYAGQDQVERLAALAPLVSQAAAAGASVATDILQRAGEALANLAAVAANQVLRDRPPNGVAVVRVGGVWAAHVALHDAFAHHLTEVLPGAEVLGPTLSPVGGALLLAMGADKAPPTLKPSVVERLRETL